MQPIIGRSLGGAEGSPAFFAAVTPTFALRCDVEGVANDVAFPDCPLNGQSGLGQARDMFLLCFIHV